MNKCVSSSSSHIYSNFSTVDTFVPGTNNNSLTIRISVGNLREDAYETRLFIVVPDAFEYGGSISTSGKSVGCSPLTTNNSTIVSGSSKTHNYMIVCDIANPLERNALIRFNFVLIVANIDLSLTKIEMQLHVNRWVDQSIFHILFFFSTNPEEDSASMRNNNVNVTIPVMIRRELALIGRSIPEHIDYSRRNVSALPRESPVFDTDVGPSVTHLYQVNHTYVRTIRLCCLLFFRLQIVVSFRSTTSSCISIGRAMCQRLVTVMICICYILSTNR